jgi:hypothetical protein
VNIGDDLTRLRAELRAERKPLDDRLYRLGYPRWARHYPGCGVGTVRGAKCTCDAIAAQARASGRLLH